MILSRKRNCPYEYSLVKKKKKKKNYTLSEIKPFSENFLKFLKIQTLVMKKLNSLTFAATNENENGQKISIKNRAGRSLSFSVYFNLILANINRFEGLSYT